MKRIFQWLFGLCALCVMLTSCLGSSDGDNTTYYDDVAITSFTLGTLNRYLTTTSSTGADSTYKATYTGSSYVMAIDQLRHEIYNRDSLPLGTDLKHVVCTLYTKNNAVPFYKSMVSDTLFYYQTTDSIDFSQPRTFRVFSSDGNYYRDYTITLTASQEANGFRWSRLPADTELPSILWTDWTFTVNADRTGILNSNDGGATWTLDNVDPALLPTEVQFTSWPLGKGLDYALMMGQPRNAESPAMSIWRKVIDNDAPSRSSWVYMPLSDDNKKYLPKGQDYRLAPYTNGSVLAIAADGTIYQSCDQGITWAADSTMALPSSFVGGVARATTDREGNIWLKEGTTGLVWRGKKD